MKTNFETEHLSQPFDNKRCQKKIKLRKELEKSQKRVRKKLNLTLTNPELFIIY